MKVEESIFRRFAIVRLNRENNSLVREVNFDSSIRNQILLGFQEISAGKYIVLDDSFECFQVNKKYAHIGRIVRDCECKHMAGPILAN